MTNELNFLSSLQPDRIDEHRFYSAPQALPGPAIYGGQLMAQVMHCAAQTVGETRPVHYLHASFIASGDPAQHLDFDVRRLRDGKSTSNRQVEVRQSGKTLMTASLSFQTASAGYSHQIPMPSAETPEALLAAGNDQPNFSDGDYPPFPFWLLVCPPGNTSREPCSSVWTKYRFDNAQDSLVQQMLFAFVSDASILQAALQPHALQWTEQGLAIATMNHSLWFHRKLAINDWLLMHSVSPSTHGGRAFATADTFSASGDLVASIAQEGILRRRPSQ